MELNNKLPGAKLELTKERRQIHEGRNYCSKTASPPREKSPWLINCSALDRLQVASESEHI